MADRDDRAGAADGPAPLHSVPDVPAYDFSICSDDLPPPFAAAWFRRSEWQIMIDSAKNAITDNPDALRNAGSAAVASAMVQAAEQNLTDGRQGVREYALLVLEYFSDEHFKHESFDFFVGLKRRDGKHAITYQSRLAQRDAVLAEMAVADHWADLTDRVAAKAMKKEFARWQANVLPRLKAAGRKSRDLSEPGKWFWPIHQIERGLPNVDDLTKAIAHARAASYHFRAGLLL